MRAIPITTRIEIIVATIGHAGITTRHTVYFITRAIARSPSPSVAMTTRPTGLPVSMGLLVAREVAVKTLARLFGLTHSVWPTLDRQITLAVL